MESNHLNENEIKTYDKASFILGIISFVLMLFIGLIPCAVAGIGAYCAYVSKNRLNLAMNVIIFFTSIMVLFIS